MNKTISENKKDVIAQLKTQLEEAIEQDNTEKIITTYAQLGQSLLEIGKAPEALSNFNEGLQKIQETENKHWEGQFQGYRGLALKKIGNQTQARAAFNKSKTIAEKFRNPALICDSRLQLAYLSSHDGNWKKSIELLQPAVSLADELDDPKRKMTLNSLLAENYLSLKDYFSSLRFYQRAAKEAAETGNMDAYSSYLTIMGKVYLDMDNPEAAWKLLIKSLSLASQTGNPLLEINALEGLYYASLSQSKKDDTRFYAEKIIELSQANEHHQGILTMIPHYSLQLINQGEYQESLPLLKQGLETANQQNKKQTKKKILSLLGYAYYNLDRLPAALESYRELFNTAVELNEKSSQALALSRISSVLADQGRTAEAISKAQDGLTLAQEEDNQELTGELQAILAFTFREVPDLKAAINYCRKAITTFQSLKEKEPQETLISLLAEMDASSNADRLQSE